MNRFCILLSLFALTISWSQSAEPLFDGKSLDGWDFTKGIWRIEDGAITAGSYDKKFPRNEFICTEKSYANFELKLKIKCDGDPATGLINSGIQIRSARLANGSVAGYQIDCGMGWFGKIYDEHRRKLIYPTPLDEAALEKGVDTYGWNEYRILAEGPRIQVWINDIKASDYTETNPDIPLNGIIAPQIHSGGHVVVQFKDVVIRALPPTEGAPTWKSLGGVDAALAKVVKRPKPRPKKPRKKTQSSRTEAWTPEQELAGFTVPEGFEIELVASEEHGVINPIDLTFDDAGRLWTQTGQMYPLDPISGMKWQQFLDLMKDEETQNTHPEFKRIKDLYQLKTKGEDKILILEDIAKPASGPLHVWADGLAIPQSILPYKDGAYVCHGSELFLLRDTDDDNKSDTMEPVLSGFGFTDTHTMSHLLVRGPGSYIHFSQGALNQGMVTAAQSGFQDRIDAACQVRFGLDHQDFEVLSAGPSNMWGLQLRANGQWYGTEANDRAYSVIPWEHGTAVTGAAFRPMRPYQPLLPELHSFRVGGTGISGLEFVEDTEGGFPYEQWKDIALLANPITSTINAVRVHRNPDGTVEAEHLPDFLSSKDDWFRPVNLEFGPDGCLYIADFYNKIVSHNEVTTDHPDRDKSHGRIWRIRHKSQKPRKIPNVTKATPEQLLVHLQAPNLWEKRAAWQQIADRELEVDLAPDLVAIAADEAKDVVTRIHALWSLEELKHFDSDLLKALLASKDGDLRREAVRSLSSFDIAPSQAAALISPIIEDENCMVRSQAIRTLGDLRSPDPAVLAGLISACKPSLGKNELGGSYERNLERFLARMALERFPAELKTYLDTHADDHASGNLLWAIQALDEQAKQETFLGIWNHVKGQLLDAETFIAISGMLDNAQVFSAVQPTFQNPGNAENLVGLALANQSRVQSKKLTEMLTPMVEQLLRDPETMALGLKAVDKFSMASLGSKVASIEIQGDDEAMLSLLLAAQSVSPKLNAANFTKVAADKTRHFEIRAEATHALAAVDKSKATGIIKSILTTGGNDHVTKLTSLFSQSKAGGLILCSLIEDKTISPDAFELSAAERLIQSHPDNPQAKRVIGTARKRLAEQRRKAQSRIHHLISYIKNNPGDPEKGKATFTTCLTCHKVGSEGQDIAPPLDGSGHRDLEHLLTAIVDPDAAVEGGYGLYRITRTNGSVVEGYLDKKESLGTTVAMMGGARVFIPQNEIRSENFVGGRSFMPPAFGQLPDETMADLVAYVGTLKEEKVTKSPNVVLIFADDLGYGDLGCYGATKVKTPSIDKLAAEGKRFTDAHSSSAVCTPSRYGLLTGEYPFRGVGGKGLWGPAPINSPLLIDTEKLTIADVFKKGGYDTAVVGKWHLGFGKGSNDWKEPLRPGPRDLGFDYYFGMPVVNSAPPYVYVENDRIVGSDPEDPLVYVGRNGPNVSPITRLPKELAYRNANHFSGAVEAHKLYNDFEVSTKLTEKSIEWIKSREDKKPFFLYLATTAVHHPITPAKRFQGSSEAGWYGDFVHELDWMVGEIMKTLEEKGVADNTLVIFTSDNGGMFNHAGRAAAKLGHKINGDLLGSKFGIWEGGHRVPFIARWPGKIEPGTVSDQMLINVDLMATFAAVSGQEFSDPKDSINMLPALTGDPQEPLRKEMFVIPNKPSHMAYRNGKWMFIPAKNDGGFRGSQPKQHAWGGPAVTALVNTPNSDIENGRLKKDAAPGQLYDLEADRNQTKNLYYKHPEVVEQMREVINRNRPKK